jgi:glycosyltransferase involved in cell wall biosynthesis
MISILMATYNGEKYVAEQLDSLFAQTRNDFTLYIRDDCSTDSTWEIIRDYESRYPERIRAVKNNRNSGGAKHNFIGMMADIKDDYVMLCDQDDVWLPDKVGKTIEKLKTMEAEYGKETPLLVHTDLKVVDENLKIIFPSFRAAMNAGYDYTKLRHLIIQNMISGCTAAYNFALAKLITVEPAFIIMHDWWLGLIAAAFGEIGRLDEQTVLYRQHGLNEIGATDVRTICFKLYMLIHSEKIRWALAETYRQAEVFLQMYNGKLEQKQIELLRVYVEIPKMNKWNRIVSICRLGTLKYGLARKTGQLLFL